MKNTQRLLAATLLSAMGMAQADVTLTTPPVTIDLPTNSGVTSRTAWCVAQNVSKATLSSVGVAVFGIDGQNIQSNTVDVQPGTAQYVAGASGGSGLVYCKFTVKNKANARGYLVLVDNTSGSPANTVEVMTLEAK